MSDKTNLSFRHSLFFCFIHSFHEWISWRKKFYLILNLDLPTQHLEEEPQVPEVKIHAAVSHQPTLATTRADAASGPVMCPGEHGGTAGCCSKWYNFALQGEKFKEKLSINLIQWQSGRQDHDFVHKKESVNFQQIKSATLLLIGIDLCGFSSKQNLLAFQMQMKRCCGNCHLFDGKHRPRRKVFPNLIGAPLPWSKVSFPLLDRQRQHIDQNFATMDCWSGSSWNNKEWAQIKPVQSIITDQRIWRQKPEGVIFV